MSSNALVASSSNHTVFVSPDTDVSPELAYYLVSARNACGSSGEEPF